MKKTVAKLVLRKEVIKALLDSDLARAAGGQQGQQANCTSDDVKSHCQSDLVIALPVG